jgi:hypothetical protein
LLAKRTFFISLRVVSTACFFDKTFPFSPLQNFLRRSIPYRMRI